VEKSIQQNIHIKQFSDQLKRSQEVVRFREKSAAIPGLIDILVNLSEKREVNQ
jgi:hypothetical protein